MIGGGLLPPLRGQDGPEVGDENKPESREGIKHAFDCISLRLL